MREVTFEEMARHMLDLERIMPVSIGRITETIATAAQERAQAKIGHYQQGIEAFPAWAPLADSTLAEKRRLGFAPPDNPLLRTGELRESIEKRVDRLAGQAQVGSNSDVMVYQELGTKTIPPRPVLGPTGAEVMQTIEKLIGPHIDDVLSRRYITP